MDNLLAAGAHQPPSWITYMFGNPIMNRDLHSTTPHGEISLNIYHPSMQEGLLDRASVSGAEVNRGVNVVGVDAGPNRSPTVTFEHDGRQQTLPARVVVGADGRAFAGSRMGRI